MGHDVRPRDDFNPTASQKMRMSLTGKGLLGLGALLCGGAFAADYSLHLHRFWWSAHVAFLFVATLTFGAIAFLAYNYVTRTRWHVVVRRFAENMALNIWFVGLLGAIVMIAGNMGDHGLFHHWLHIDPADEVMAKKAGYFNLTFYVIRSVCYILIPGLIAVFLCGKSFRQDKDGDYRHTQHNQRFSTVFTIAMALLITFAGIDWSMALDPHWFSTMFGIYTLAGCLISIHCALVLAKHWIHKLGALKNTITVEHDHDLGKLMFGFTIFWAYIGYSQFMLIWYANIPEETFWFHHRWEGSWKYVSMLLIGGKFILPFLFLMSRHVKKKAILLSLMAVWMLLMHYVDIYWQVMPVFSPAGVPAAPVGLLIDLAVIVGFVGLWTGLFMIRTSGRPLVPVQDPFLEDSIKFENF